MKSLTIKFAAPLQSFGNEASYNHRTSYGHPSKSAVIGMIAAALGYGRSDNHIQALNDLSFAVRTDQGGRILRDYQIVRYGEHSIDLKQTYRDYLQDALFIVAVGSNDYNLMDSIKDALQNPRYQLYLGRRSNPPAGPLIVNSFDELNPVEVLRQLDWQANSWYKKTFSRRQSIYLEIYGDADLMPDRPNELVRDCVGSFDQADRFHEFRAVAKDYLMISIKSNQTNDQDTNHDFMGNL